MRARGERGRRGSKILPVMQFCDMNDTVWRNANLA